MNAASWARSASAALALALPPALLLGSVLLVATPAFVRLEYASPGFPGDAVGFAAAERTAHACELTRLLGSGRGAAAISALHFPPGSQAPAGSCLHNRDRDCSRLYNDREVAHLMDVASVLRDVRLAGLVLAAVLLGAGTALARAGKRRELARGLRGGAALALALDATLAVVVLAGFDGLFRELHGLLFPGGTWTFFAGDTLMRLFPPRFWRDAAAAVVGVSAAAALAVGAASFRVKREPIENDTRSTRGWTRR